MAKRIAIVEDEVAIRENYVAAFKREGYAVDAYEARGPALEAFAARLPDLVVIDVNLKDDVEGGFELCRELRSRAPDLPIIFLTARDSEFDAVSGLRLGADDYLTKDISLPHLMARIAALFRRLDAMSKPQAAQSRITRGDLEIDTDRMMIAWQGQPIGLTLTEFWLVHAMARYPGHVKNRQQLMDAAQAVLDDNTITSHIKRIRRKFVAVDADFDAIETVYGMGYRWLSS
ncbi:MAG: proteobacterial dedicated sortase system response regulator [Gammaproteobacteria bacterium]|nr:proteobacterial dedicated sortase system response regulator [Pseudomonadota bacterium]MCH8135054.1 proteobacterial dedicated sortase system response regulator [Pseudomonadota bacterium]TDJ41901.1 MAG: proteobacterial dedicated sortase system response regulator [Gammaproteobacteria bacterium]